MDFTREPIIETVITPKEGFKLVVRSSKTTGQEEYFVDAIEVVSFGSSLFFRNLERPKSFLVPVSDYEILEVREARMVLKNVGIDRSIKIGGGREAKATVKEQPVEKEVLEEQPIEQAEPKPEIKLEKKRERRGRHYRRRRGRDDLLKEETEEPGEESEELSLGLPIPKKIEVSEGGAVQPANSTSILTSLLPPPPTLISETIARYKDNVLFKGAFFNKEEAEKEQEEASKELIPEEEEDDEKDLFNLPLEQPAYGSFTMSIEEEEEIYKKRQEQKEAESGLPLPEPASEVLPSPAPEHDQGAANTEDTQT